METIQKNIMRFEPNEELFEYRTDGQMLVWMKPSEFLDKAPKLRPEYLAFPPTHTFVEKLKDKMKKDIPIDPLYLDVDTVNCKIIKHEGRHRAMAAEKAGIARVPVIIYLRDNHDNYISIKEYLGKGCRCSYIDAKQQEG